MLSARAARGDRTDGVHHSRPRVKPPHARADSATASIPSLSRPSDRVATFEPEPGVTVKLVAPAEIARLIRAGDFVSQLHLGSLLLAELHGFLGLPRPPGPTVARSGSGRRRGKAIVTRSSRSSSRRSTHPLVEAGHARQSPRRRGSSGMPAIRSPKAGYLPPKPFDPFAVHPSRRHQERQQPGQIVIASGGRVEDADALLRQRGAGSQAQPRIGLRRTATRSRIDDAAAFERRHRKRLGRTCEPAADLA